MIKEIKHLIKKYQDIAKNGAEIVYITEIMNDLYQLIGQARIKRLPKKDR